MEVLASVIRLLLHLFPITLFGFRGVRTRRADTIHFFLDRIESGRFHGSVLDEALLEDCATRRRQDEVPGFRIDRIWITTGPVEFRVSAHLLFVFGSIAPHVLQALKSFLTREFFTLQVD